MIVMCNTFRRGRYKVATG